MSHAISAMFSSHMTPEHINITKVATNEFINKPSNSLNKAWQFSEFCARKSTINTATMDSEDELLLKYQK